MSEKVGTERLIHAMLRTSEPHFTSPCFGIYGSGDRKGILSTKSPGSTISKSLLLRPA